ncbi:MAG: hypothetical protein FWG99_06570 [Treponema sp.]|nr:hypothetical protein [Treponema sp.]
MKTFNFIVKISIVILMIGILFLSCADGEDGGGSSAPGTLIIDLSNSESLVNNFSASFRNNLQYEIECTSPGLSAVKETAYPGTDPVSILLTAGTWDVAIKVVNKEDPEDPLGVETIPGISIRANLTVTEVPDAIVMDTSRCEIIVFVFKIGENSYDGDIQGTTIVVSVPSEVYGNVSAAVSLQITHTGASYAPANDTPLQSFLSGNYSIVVAAQDGAKKTYTVQVTGENAGGTTDWPAVGVWQSFGFPQGIEIPAGFQSYYSVSENMLNAGLYDAGKPAFDLIISEIVKNGYTSGVSTGGGADGFNEYTIEFKYDGKDFILSIITSGTSPYNNYPSNHLVLTILNKSYDPDFSNYWPSNTVLSRFGLSGLLQPDGTTVEVGGPKPYTYTGTDIVGSQGEFITIEIPDGNDTEYDNLLYQIVDMNNPKFDHTNRDSSRNRSDEFEFESKSGTTILVRNITMGMPLSGGKITLIANYVGGAFNP